MKIFSEEWITEFIDRINENGEYERTAKEWVWPLVITLERDHSELPLYMDLKNGRCLGARVASSADLEEAKFVLSATEDTWGKIMKNKLDPVMAVVTNKLKIRKGDPGVMAKHVNATKELIRSAARIPAEF